MESLKDIARRQQSDHPAYFDDPAHDQWLRLILELCEEICVRNDRLDTIERLTEAGVAATAEAIEDYQPSDEIVQERLRKHQELFERVFERLQSAENSKHG